MGIVQNLSRRVASAFGYDVLEPKNRRKPLPRAVQREDAHAKGARHSALQANALDLSRNLSLVQWMLRKHLDYVSMFRFQCQSDDERLNAQIERLMAEDSIPERSDVAGRFGREKMFRFAELNRSTAGDVLLYHTNDGRMQGIAADLIKNPTERVHRTLPDGQEWVNGVKVDSTGRHLGYAVHRRKGDTGSEFIRTVSPAEAFIYGFYERFPTDQVRGISPIVTALAPLQDVYEGFNYGLAKMKVQQLVALAFFRESNQLIGDVSDITEDSGDTPDDDSTPQDDTPKYEVDFGGGPQVLDLEPGDDAKFLHTTGPGMDSQDFIRLIIMVALKAFDLPYSFFDEKHTNFFGSRAGWLHYERSAKDKRDDQKELRRRYTLMKLAQWVRDDRLFLPRGVRITQIPCEWIPLGMPWWDPSKEIKGQKAAIRGALTNPQEVCKQTGSDFYTNVDQIARAQAYAEEKGVVLDYSETSGSDRATGNPEDSDEPGENVRDSENDN